MLHEGSDGSGARKTDGFNIFLLLIYFCYAMCLIATRHTNFIPIVQLIVNCLKYIEQWSRSQH